MNKNDIIEFLPTLHNMQYRIEKGQKGLTKYQLCKALKMGPSRSDYTKINECIIMGLIKQVNDNPPEFLPDKNKIWEFWKNTPAGQESIKMIGDHAAVFE